MRCPEQAGQAAAADTRRGETKAALCSELSNTLDSGGGNFVVWRSRGERALEDYKGSESDTLNSHSQQALFSFNCDGELMMMMMMMQNYLNEASVAQQTELPLIFWNRSII